MSGKRRSDLAELKPKIALEALRDESTMSELAARYDVHPNRFPNRKKKAREQVLSSVSGKTERQAAGVTISMDGKGRWLDNVFIERLWRSLKSEQACLAEYATGSEARTGIAGWIEFYNRRRPHSSLADRTPEEAYSRRAARRPGSAPPPRSRKRPDELTRSPSYFGR